MAKGSVTSTEIKARIDQIQKLINSYTKQREGQRLASPEWYSLIQLRTSLEGNYLTAKLLEHLTVPGVELPQEGRLFRDDET